ncbi:MAG: recombination protein RmuC, partial [Actinomycetota bacterium]|nr:recombination protein RmuC [Actinomycetota bacterium]
MVIGLLLGVVFGLVGGCGAGAYLVAAARTRNRVQQPPPPDTGELVTRLLEANRTLLEQERLRATSELDGKKGLIDQQLVSMTGELGKVNELVRELEHDRHKAFGELSNELRRQHEGLNALSEHTQQLREALANSRVRGQWGERMAEDVLRLAGFLEGVNYRKQATLASAGRPDYTFLLPKG